MGDLPESVLAVISSFTVHGSHPTEFDKMKRVSLKLQKAIIKNPSVFNSGRVLEISYARDSILNGLYYESQSETIASDETWIKFVRDDGSFAVLKRQSKHDPSVPARGYFE